MITTYPVLFVVVCLCGNGLRSQSPGYPRSFSVAPKWDISPPKGGQTQKTRKNERFFDSVAQKQHRKTELCRKKSQK